MNAETIKDFLVSLGFQIDEAGAKTFDAVLTGVTANVMKTATAVEGAAATVLLFTTKIASGLDNLYWTSQRTGASVAGIKALGYAASQTGASAESAKGSLESLSHFMRNNPGAESFLNRLGVQTRDASGNMRDMSAVFTDVGQQLSKMPYYRANQFAQMLGIDENTLMAMRRGLGQFTAEYSAMAKAIGFNADEAAAGSNRFMTSLRDFSAMAGMVRDKIGANLANGLAGSIDNLRKQILDNFPRIEETLTKLVKGILWLAEIFGKVVYRLIQAVGSIISWWKSLDTGTKQLIATMGGLLVAWRVLNAAFALTPIGIILTLLAAIGLLIDDYQTWKEGGDSLIDWSKWEPGIKYAIKGIGGLSGDISKLGTSLVNLGKALGDAFVKLMALINVDTSGFSGKKIFDILIESIRSASKMLSSLLDALTQLTKGDFSGAWDSLKEAANAGINSPIAQGTTAVSKGLYNRLNDKVNQYLPEWLGGSPSVKKPIATKSGEVLLEWLQPKLAQLESLYHLPNGLLKSIAITESAGNPNAVSGAGAEGLFQIMPKTGEKLGLKNHDAFDPIKSAEAAAKLLSQLMKMNGGDLEKSLASYNWGIGNVQKYGMALAPKETRNYIPKVLSNMPGHTVNQKTEITINGVSDPIRAGMEVVNNQTNVNSRLSQQVIRGPR